MGRNRTVRRTTTSTTRRTTPGSTTATRPAGTGTTQPVSGQGGQPTRTPSGATPTAPASNRTGTGGQGGFGSGFMGGGGAGSSQGGGFLNNTPFASGNFAAGGSLGSNRLSRTLSGTGKRTVGGLVPAKLYAINSSEQPLSPSLIIYCAFNPDKYSISVSSSFTVKGLNPVTKDYNIEADLKNEQPRELKLQELWFDAYENQVRDVRPITEALMDLAQLKDQSAAASGNALLALLSALKPQPAKVMFEWGAFKFRGLIKSLNLDYVMFTSNGTPVRAKASITLVEYKHRKAFPKQNPTSGHGPAEQVWVVTAGDRLDTIAAQVYGDATRWRQIAKRNHIDDPFSLQPGRELMIPVE